MLTLKHELISELHWFCPVFHAAATCELVMRKLCLREEILPQGASNLQGLRRHCAAGHLASLDRPDRYKNLFSTFVALRRAKIAPTFQDGKPPADLFREMHRVFKIAIDEEENVLISVQKVGLITLRVHCLVTNELLDTKEQNLTAVGELQVSQGWVLHHARRGNGNRQGLIVWCFERHTCAKDPRRGHLVEVGRLRSLMVDFTCFDFCCKTQFHFPYLAGQVHWAVAN